MPKEKKLATVIQSRTMELRKLKVEERMLEKLLSEANEQLTKLQVEALELQINMKRHPNTATGNNE